MMLIVLLIGVIQGMSNDQVRECLLQNISFDNEETGSCRVQYELCFDDLQCSNQFEDIFGVCNIESGTETYTNRCVVEGFASLDNQLLFDLFHCLSSKCEVLEGRINLRRSHKISAEQCLQNSLVDSGKCWALTKICKESCYEDIDQLKQCDDVIKAGNTIEIRKCFDKYSIKQAEALNVKKCLLQFCL